MQNCTLYYIYINIYMLILVIQLFQDVAQLEHKLLFIVLVSFSIITITGNALVIIAVMREHTLHTPTNYFITSLAISDGLIGLLVMPFG